VNRLSFSALVLVSLTTTFLSGAEAKPAARDNDGRAKRSSRTDRDSPKDAKVKDSKTEKTEDDVVHKVKSTPQLSIIAKDLMLNDVRAEKLKRIATRFFNATRVRLVVTGGSRTPEKQAQLMLAKFLKGDDVDSLYENQAALREIKRAYHNTRAETKAHARLERAIEAVIVAQVARGEFISKHLQFAAVDVRSRGMTSTLEAAFRAAVAAESGVTLVDERNAAEPHFHLGM
jgi:hypothetical protein